MKVLSVILSCALILILTGAVHAKTLRLKNGQTVTGRVVGITDAYVKLEVQGIERTYYFDEIEGHSVPGARAGSKASSRQPLIKGSKLFERMSPAVVSLRMRARDLEGEFFCQGFIVGPDGLVATALHCASWFDEIQVRLKNGMVYPVTAVAAYDDADDVCILKINAHQLPTVPLGTASNTRLDKTLYTILVSTSYHYQMAEGRLLAHRMSYGRRGFRCNLPIISGNSGGPVFDERGFAIGLHSSMELNSSNYRYFAPLDGVKKLISTAKVMSLDEFRKAVRVQGILDRGELFLHQGSTHTAINCFRTAVRAQPGSVEALGHLGDALLIAGKTDESIGVYLMAYALEPKEAWTSMGLASAYLVKKQYDTALPYAEKGVRDAPEDPLALQLLGEACFANRRYLESSAALKKSVILAPENCGAYPTLSAACMLQGQVMQGKAYLDEARKLGCRFSEEAEKVLEKSIDKAWWLGTPRR